jgi:hypothetical protein
VLAGTQVLAQPRIDQRWSAGSQALAARPIYSYNNSWILLPSGNGFLLYRASDGSMRQTFFFGSMARAAFSGNSQQIFFSANNGIYRVNNDASGMTVVTTDAGIRLIATSRDGNSLAYTNDTGAGTELVLWDIATAAVKWRVALSSVPEDLKFTNDSSKVVVDGPKLFNTSDGLVALDASLISGPFEVSPDGTTVFGTQGANLLSVDVTGATAVVNYTVPNPVPSYPGTGIALSNGADRILIPGRDAMGNAIVGLVRPTNGALVANMAPSLRENLGSQVALASASTRREIVLTQFVPGPGGMAPYAIAEQSTYTAAGASTLLNDLSGISYGVRGMDVGNHVLSPGEFLPIVAIGSSDGTTMITGGVQVRDLGDGKVLTVIPGLTTAASTNALAFNKSANRLAAVGTFGGVNGVHVFDIPSGALVGSAAGPAESVDFIGDSEIIVSQVGNVLQRYDVGLVGLVPTVGYVFPTTPILAVSPDGSQAFGRHPGGFQVNRIRLATGVRTFFQVAAAPNGLVQHLSFDEAGFLYAGYANPPDRMAIRKIDVSGMVNPPPVVRVYLHIVPSLVGTQSYAASPDGRFVSLAATWLTPGPDVRLDGNMFLHRADTGRQLLRYNQQFGVGLRGLAFTPDSLGLAWGRVDPGLVVANLPVAAYGLLLAPEIVEAGQSSVGTFELTVPNPNADTTVTLTSDNAIATVPATITIPAGSLTGTFPVDTTGVNTPTTVRVTGTVNGFSRFADLLVRGPRPASLTFNKADYASGETAQVTITLTGLAGTGGLPVTLSGFPVGAGNTNPYVIPAGTNQATFNVNVGSVATPSTININATVNGGTATGSYNVVPPTLTAFTSTRQTIIGGNAMQGRVTISARAPAGGLVVTLSSNNSAASVPATVTVAAGNTQATFNITTSAVASNQTVTLTASLPSGSSVQRVINVVRP